VTKPLLNPPCKGWQRDLPGPNAPPADAPDLVFEVPHHLDEVFLEISRRVMRYRGLPTLFSLPLVWCLIVGVWLYWDDWSLSSVAIMAFMTCLLGSLAWSGVRLDLASPRDEPIRFNRLRRKIYVYSFRHTWPNPFARWYVTTEAYDWDDIRAESWKLRGATANGMLIINEGVSLAVVKRGTNEVIDRFHLSGSVQTSLWAYICTYMQNGPEALEPCDAPMRDANDTYNPITRLAPKVQWPEAMDIESRTAPSSYSGAPAAGVLLCGQSPEPR